MEELDYLIRTLTYKRSCLEQNMKKYEKNSIEFLSLFCTQEGLNIAISEIYKLVAIKTNDQEKPKMQRKDLDKR